MVIIRVSKGRHDTSLVRVTNVRPLYGRIRAVVFQPCDKVSDPRRSVASFKRISRDMGRALRPIELI
jgi:hypothetical protein